MFRTQRTAYTQDETVEVQQNLRIAVDMVSRDLRMAGMLVDTRVLVLSMESDRRFVVEALGAGAKGYIMKESVFAELGAAIRTVADNETYLGPRITELIINPIRAKLQPIVTKFQFSFQWMLQHIVASERWISDQSGD